MKILFFFSLLVPLVCPADVLEGVAKSLKGEVLYLEKHLIERDQNGLNKFIQVEYKKPNGLTFATMTSDFSMSKTVPNTTFEDTRFQTKSTIKVVDGFVEFEDTKNNKTISKKRMPFVDSMVASQGFDNFILINSSTLDSKPVEFKFGVLEKKDFYSLVGYRKPSSLPDHLEYGIKSTHWFIRVFTNELKVVYDSKNKKLKSFTGRSNILTDSGEPQDVVITYQWKD